MDNEFVKEINPTKDFSHGMLMDTKLRPIIRQGDVWL